ncbi:MAG: lipid-A-disaccharide synthase [Desulfamplus sp.]|nr:lipid-A-disaccharide synthase [Desulfamplus sp.]
MKKHKHIFIIAGEPSGDLHGANLVKSLKQKDSSLIITGIGGDLMSHEGMELFFHIRNLSVMGVTEVVMQFRRIKEAYDLLCKKMVENRPDLLLLIDYPGFNLKAAAFAKKRSIPVLYYITPKVWAWKRSRLAKIKQYVDHAALIFPFEEAIFKKEKIPATFVGHPLLDHYQYFGEPSFRIRLDRSCSDLHEDHDLKSHSDFNKEHDPLKKTDIKKKSSKVIGLLPGSRESEISGLLPIMLESCRLINKQLNDRQETAAIFIVSAASSINIRKFDKILEPYNQDGIFEVEYGGVEEIFRRCDLLIAASGTVTLEAAICGVPMVIVYKTAFLTYFLAKLFVTIPHVGLPNIVARYPIVPELLQNDATPEKISFKVLSMIDSNSLISIKKQLLMIPRYLGGTGASKRTAHIALQMIERSSCFFPDAQERVLSV